MTRTYQNFLGVLKPQATIVHKPTFGVRPTTAKAADKNELRKR